MFGQIFSDLYLGKFALVKILEGTVSVLNSRLVVACRNSLVTVLGVHVVLLSVDLFSLQYDAGISQGSILTKIQLHTICIWL